MNTDTARERPILFSGPMVRAILAGTKSQTRRIVDPSRVPPNVVEVVPSLLAHRGDLFDFRRTLDNPTAIRCPYGVPGDRLWVRETWGVGCRPDPFEGWVDGIEYRADSTGDGEPIPLRPDPSPNSVDISEYRAGWHPSIHMPRWASRLTLELLAVRVQRLQDISEADAKAEGVTVPDGQDFISAVGLFAALWDKINGKRAPWVSNPWVWALTFRSVKGGAA